MILSFDDVTFRYPGSHTVLDRLSLAIGLGEAVALVGANGAGKTTVTRLATALEHPVGGTVKVAGRATEGLAPEDLSRDVAYLFQHVDQQLFANSVAAEVAFGPANAGAGRDEILAITADVLQRVGLLDEKNTHPFDLAPAQRKLVGLASALAQRPRLLILDEPTQGMDWRRLLIVAGTVRRQVEEGHSVLAVTHDLSLLAEAFDRVVVLAEGKVQADLSVTDVVGNPELAGSLGLAVPMVPALSLGLDLPGRPLRFEDVVREIRNVAGGRNWQ